MSQFPILDPKILDETNYPVDLTYTYSTDGRKSVDFMFSKGINVSKKIKNGFLKKYFPRFDILPVTKSIELYNKIEFLEDLKYFYIKIVT